VRLRRLRLTRFRQFADQELRLDPNVTVVVGRNDTGKTGVLWQFFNQPFYEGALHSGDRPLIREVHGQPIEFGMTWDVEAAHEVAPIRRS
jgi:recombinational DNA repair ATPase RecF